MAPIAASESIIYVVGVLASIEGHRSTWMCIKAPGSALKRLEAHRRWLYQYRLFLSSDTVGNPQRTQAHPQHPRMLSVVSSLARASRLVVPVVPTPQSNGADQSASIPSTKHIIHNVCAHRRNQPEPDLKLRYTHDPRYPQPSSPPRSPP